MEYITLDTQYYKITGYLNKKSAYVQNGDMYEYERSNETKFYDIKNIYKFINCGIFIWKVSLPKKTKYTIKDGIGQSNHLILSECEDVDSFVVKNSLYETTCYKRPLLKKFGDTKQLKINDNILKHYPELVKNILPPNINNAREYTQMKSDVIENEVYDIAIKKAINTNPHVLAFIIKPRKELIMNALLKDGMCLQYVKSQTREMCLVAISVSPSAFQYVREYSLGMCFEALDNDINNYQYIPKRYKKECTVYRDKLILDKNQKEEKLIKEREKEKLEREEHSRTMMNLLVLGAQDIYLMSC